MRERLIELLSDAEREHLNYEMANKFCPFDDYKCHSGYIADYLLDNGVVVLPYKVGDVVYVVSNYYSGDLEIYKCKIESLTFYVNNAFISCCSIDSRFGKINFGLNVFEFGKTVFLTREEAERALKGE